MHVLTSGDEKSVGADQLGSWLIWICSVLKEKIQAQHEISKHSQLLCKYSHACLISKDKEMHHTFMFARNPTPKVMATAETSTFRIFCGRNVRDRNVQAETSVAEMSEHPLLCVYRMIF